MTCTDLLTGMEMYMRQIPSLALNVLINQSSQLRPIMHTVCTSGQFIKQMYNARTGPLIARFMRPTWCQCGADRTQVGPMLAPWILLSGLYSLSRWTSYRKISLSLEAARFGFRFFPSLWNSTGISQRCCRGVWPWHTDKKTCITKFRTCAQSIQLSKPYQKFAEYHNTATMGK